MTAPRAPAAVPAAALEDLVPLGDLVPDPVPLGVPVVVRITVSSLVVEVAVGKVVEPTRDDVVLFTAVLVGPEAVDELGVATELLLSEADEDETPVLVVLVVVTVTVPVVMVVLVVLVLVLVLVPVTLVLTMLVADVVEVCCMHISSSRDSASVRAVITQGSLEKICAATRPIK